MTKHTQRASGGTGPLLRHVPRPTRRQQFSASTRRALIEVAQELFTTHGYAGTSLDAIVAGADVTKGALYHHFSGKQAVFEAVFEETEAAAAAHINAAITDLDDPWDKAMTGLRAFLEVVQEPTYRRIVVQEGPAILGYERFREQEERSSFDTVREIVRSVMATSAIDVDDDMILTFSQIFFGAMSAAGESVTGAADPAAASARVQTAIAVILAGLRSLAEQGLVPQALVEHLDDASASGSLGPAGTGVDDEVSGS